MVGRKVSDILPSAAAANADRHDAETLQAGSAVDFAVDFQAADGTRKYVTSLKFPIPDPNGDMRWIGAIAEDVTERSDAAGALRASERDLRRILDNMIDVFFRTDPVGTIIMASPSVGGLLGIPLEQCLGRRITDFFVDGDGFPRFMRELDVHGGQLYGYEAAFRAVDGREIWVSTTAHYFTDEAGVPCGIEGVARDITERKRAEQALHRLSHAIDQSPVAVILTDTDGVVEYVNSRFFELSGDNPDELVAALGGTMAENAEGAGFQEGARLAVGGTGDWRGEYQGKRRNGEPFLASVLVSPISDPRGTVTNYLIVLEDVTETREMETRLHQIQKMEAMGQLTGGIAHDFNNILAIVMTGLEFLDESLDEEDALRRRMVDSALRAVRRGATLTERLLAFSRKQNLNAEPIDLATTIEEMVEMLQRTLGETIAVKTVTASNLRWVMCDRNRFENALLNLAVNARDAMPRGGSLDIELDNVEVSRWDVGLADVRPGSYVRITVRDTGEGMPASVRDRVFEPFFTTKGKGEGTGLGLSMVYGFVQQSGGGITLHSQEGFGTTIRIYLPAAVGRGESVIDPHDGAGETQDDGHGGDETILVVEDDPAVREGAVAILKSLGYTVLEAGNGDDALALLDQGGVVDLLFADVVMPGGISGPELAEKARRTRPGLRVLFTTGYSAGQLSERDLIAAGTTMLKKPYAKRDLSRTVRHLIDGRSR